MNELIQKNRSKQDKLRLDNGIIFHEWDLGNEKGTKQTAIKNIDPNFSVVEKRTESRIMYYTLAVILFLIFVFSHPESLLGNLGGWIALGLGCVFLLAGIFRKEKRYIDMIYTKQGGLFAVIRRDWVDKESRDEFLRTLKNSTCTDPVQLENKPGGDNPD